uniref:Uncharacterized protein n=1 Tax=Steinernema glaseri TaxID=37863 RepID=A0A1I7Y780_9BILA
MEEMTQKSVDKCKSLGDCVQERATELLTAEEIPRLISDERRLQDLEDTSPPFREASASPLSAIIGRTRNGSVHP